MEFSIFVVSSFEFRSVWSLCSCSCSLLMCVHVHCLCVWERTGTSHLFIDHKVNEPTSNSCENELVSWSSPTCLTNSFTERAWCSSGEQTHLVSHMKLRWSKKGHVCKSCKHQVTLTSFEKKHPLSTAGIDQTHICCLFSRNACLWQRVCWLSLPALVSKGVGGVDTTLGDVLSSK